MYSFGRRNTYNPFVGSLKKRISTKEYIRFVNTFAGAIIEVEVSEEQYVKAKVLLEHFISNSHLYNTTIGDLCIA